jgi:hypothetical protein
LGRLHISGFFNLAITAIGFEVITAVGMNRSSFWDTTPVARKNLTRKTSQAELAICIHSVFLLGLFFDFEYREVFLRNVD